MAELTLISFEMAEGMAWSNALECYLSCIQPYTVLYVDSRLVYFFFESVVPKLTVPIVLYMGNGDNPNPGFDVSSPRAEEQIRKHFAHIYFQNCKPAVEWERIADIITCVPIGLAYWPDNIMRSKMHHTLQYRYGNYGKYLSYEDIDNGRIDDGAQRHRDEHNYILLNFEPGNNHEKRDPAVDYFCNNKMFISGESQSNPEVQISPFNRLGMNGRDHSSAARCVHYSSISKMNVAVSGYRFVLSPEGNGPDCFRTWETLMLGAYPVVVTSQLDQLYEGLPVLIVDNYTSITPALLDNTYKAFRAKTWNLEKLYNHYWEKRIYAKRAALGGPKSRLQYNLL